MGWAYDNKRQRRFQPEDMANPLNRKLAGMGVDGIYARPKARTVESNARTRAMRGIGYRGPIDQDGYACDGPGADPGRFATGPGWEHLSLRSLRVTAWTAGQFDGGWDGDDNGEGPLTDWVADRAERDRGER